MQSIGQAAKELLERIQVIRSTTIHSPMNNSNEYEKRQDSSKKTNPDCNKCQDENGYIINENGMQLWKICECVPAKKIRNMMKSSQITDDFRQLTFENFETKGKHSQIEYSFLMATVYANQFETIEKNRHNSFALVGQVGSGKTHLLCAISNYLLSKGVQVIYFPFVEGLNNLKNNFDELEEKTDRLKKARVLFIDDLFKGRDKPTAWQIETMFSIVNYRYLNHLPILLTSEKNFGMLCDIDEALGSRLFEMTRGNRMELVGKQLNFRMTDFE